MSIVVKILLFTLIFYFLFSTFKRIMAPPKKKQEKQKDVRIFKKGKIEESKLDTSEAETVEYEEIKTEK